MSLDLDDIIATAASRHGIIVRRDDPIVATVALHDIIMEQHHARIVASVETIAARLEQTSEAQARRARAVATEVISEAVSTAEQAITAHGQQVMRTTNAAIDQHQATVEQLQRLRTWLWVAWFIAGTAIIALALSSVA